MKEKKLWILLVSLIFTVCLVFSAAAQEKEASAYGMGNHIYVFYEGQDTGENVRLYIGQQQAAGVGGIQIPAPIERENGIIHYFLLLDRSSSMRAHKEEIRGFLSALMEETKGQTLVTVLSFGDAFQSELERALDQDAVLKALDGISYDETKTDVFEGLWWTMDYLNLQKRSPKELYQVIMVTDGFIYNDSGEFTLEQIQKRMENMPEIFFEAGCLNFNQEKESVFSQLGKVSEIGKGAEAADLAYEIADRINQLLFLDFELQEELSGTALDIKLNFMESQNVLDIQGIPVLEENGVTARQPGGNENEEPEKEASQPGETEGQTEEPESQEEETEEQPSEEEESGQTEETESQAEGMGEQTEESGSEAEGTENHVEEAESQTEETESEGRGLPLWVFGTAGGVLAAIICIGAAVKFSGKGGKSGRTQRSGTGISIKLEVISGSYTGKRKDFWLDRELIIGSGKNSDILFADRCVSERNSRIFMRDGIVYIEDLSSDRGTAVGGMRIFAPNRLRSGDVISIGNVQFRLIFE